MPKIPCALGRVRTRDPQRANLLSVLGPVGRPAHERADLAELGGE